MIEILTSAAILAGVFFAIVGAAGIVRFPDAYCRLHGQGIVTSLGVPLVLLASVIYFSGVSASVSLKGLLAIVFLFLTSPVATHLIGWSAHRSGVPMSKRTAVEGMPAVEDSPGIEGAQAGVATYASESET